MPFAKKRQALFPKQASIQVREEKGDFYEPNGIAAERLVSDMKLVMRDAEDLLKATADEVGNKTKEARLRLAETLRTAQAKCSELEAKAIEGAKAADRTIRTHPYQSIGVALGVGVVVGLLLKRK